MPLRPFLRIVASGRRTARNLSSEEAERAFRIVLSGQASPAQIAAFLVAVRWKGETVDELTGFARAARGAARLPSVSPEGLVGVGTPLGGRVKGPPLEVAGAILAAACGTRSFFVADRSKAGSEGLTVADVFHALGGGWTDDVDRATALLVDAGVVALAASTALPGLVRLVPLRDELEVRTALHTVEKLLAVPECAVLVGAAAGPVLGVAADVLRALGHRRGILLQGAEGSVVPSVVAPTKGLEIDGDALTTVVVDPSDYGYRTSREPRATLPGAAGAADAIRGVLQGERGAVRDASVLSSALIQYAAGNVASIAEGVGRATEAIEQGLAKKVLASLERR